MQLRVGSGIHGKWRLRYIAIVKRYFWFLGLQGSRAIDSLPAGRMLHVRLPDVQPVDFGFDPVLGKMLIMLTIRKKIGNRFWADAFTAAVFLQVEKLL